MFSSILCWTRRHNIDARDCNPKLVLIWIFSTTSLLSTFNSQLSLPLHHHQHHHSVCSRSNTIARSSSSGRIVTEESTRPLSCGSAAYRGCTKLRCSSAFPRHSSRCTDRDRTANEYSVSSRVRQRLWRYQTKGLRGRLLRVSFISTAINQHSTSFTHT